MPFALQDPTRLAVDSLDIHRGAIDKTTVTSQCPIRVMPWVKRILLETGIEIQKIGNYNYRCVRRAKEGRVNSSESSTSADSFSSVEGGEDPEASSSRTQIAQMTRFKTPQHQVRYCLERMKRRILETRLCSPCS